MNWLLRLLAHLYPLKWRARYGSEFDALLEDVKPTWRQASDIFGGAIRMQILRGTTYLKLAAALAIAGAIAGGVASYTAPRPYVSSEVFRVQANQYPGRPVSNEVLSDRLATRFSDISLQLNGYQALLAIITGLNLYPEERRRMPDQDLIDKIRRDGDIQVKWIEFHGADGGVAPALRVSFAYPDSQKAQAAIRLIAERLVTLNASANRSHAELWNAFFDQSSTVPDAVRLELLQAPTLPQKPDGPSYAGYIALGAGVGGALALLVALTIRRTKWTLRVFAFAAAGATLGFAISLWLTTYTSTGTLRFMPAEIPERTPSAVSPAQLVQRSIRSALSDENLIDILHRIEPDFARRASIQQLKARVQRMRTRDIRITPLLPPVVPLGSASAFSISFTYSDPHKAQVVVSSLVSRMTEDFQAALKKRLDQRYTSDEVRRIEERKVGTTLDVIAPAGTPEERSSPSSLTCCSVGLALGILFGMVTPRLPWRRTLTLNPG